MMEDALLVFENKEMAEKLIPLLKDARVKVIAPGMVDDVKTSFYEYIYMIGDCTNSEACRYMFHTTVKPASKPSTVWFWP